MTVALSDANPDPGTLPRWDLSDLFPGPESPELAETLAGCRRDSETFAARYEGRLAALAGADLAAAIREYERLDEALSRIMSYAYLRYAEDMTDGDAGRFFQTMQEQVTDISSALLFFTLEINRLSDGHVNKLLAVPEVAAYRPWLDQIRRYRAHQLADDMERLLHEKYVVGRSAWTRLFDETVASLTFTVDGRDMGSAEALNLLSHTDGGVRRRAAHEIGRVFGANIRLFAQITNTLAKDHEIEDKWRRYPRPDSARNLGNQVEDSVVDALVAAVTDAYPRLSHRYYHLKAGWFGGSQLDYWDRNAPLPDDADRQVPWDEAVTTVLDAYHAFSPELADIGRRFFDRPWIHAPVTPGKAPGAFAHPTVPSAHPYLLVNYQGRIRDVMTLAHELGHGVHQVLAGGQGHLLSQTPLTLAETASVFGEMLTFRALLAEETEPRRRRALLASKVEDMLNTVVRQTAFYQFERRVHDQRREGELAAETLGDIWMEVQTESLGPALRFDDQYRAYWSYIPHFIHSPFYVYAYAFGDCLVNALYARYQESEAGFVDRYLTLLRAGGSQGHRELLAPFGLDAADPAFWSRGLDVIAAMIDELEALE